MSVVLGQSLATAALCFALTGCSSTSLPISDANVAGFTADLSSELSRSEPLVAALTADEAVWRAVHHNHTVRVKELESALTEAKVRAQAGAMLPSIVAESDYYRRDRPSMSHSNLSSIFSTSTDLRTISRDIAVSWNILDFGLSLIRAQQGLDKALQQNEEANRVRSRIVEETRATFWRAVALERLEVTASRLDREVNAALVQSRAASRDPRLDPMASINYQRDILNSRRELNVLQTNLAGAVDQLKQSIGLPNIEKLPLNTDQTAHLMLPTTSSVDDIAVALRHRPEIRQHIYDLRITDAEVSATILQLLPGVTLSKSFASDTNSYLLHGNWVSWGVKIASNLMEFARLPVDLDAIDAQQHVHRQSALATAAAIAMQVHVARARMAVHVRAHRDARHFAEVQKQLLHQVQTSVRLGQVGHQALAREKLATLLAEVRSIVAYADLNAAFAGYATAMGNPEIPNRIVIANSWNRIDVEESNRSEKD
jgi:outer membrane protein TolC